MVEGRAIGEDMPRPKRAQTEQRYWSRPLIHALLAEYKQWPCLWKIKSKDYSNRTLKNKAYDALVRLCMADHPDIDRPAVTYKIQHLRSAFRKERHKIRASRARGGHVPTLWYYKHLLFTLDQRSGDDDDDDDGEREEEEEAVRVEEVVAVKREVEEEEGDVSSERHQVCPDSCIQGDSRTAEDVPRDPSERSPDIDEAEAVGIVVGKKLKRMDPVQRIYAEKIIGDVLARGLLGRLKGDSI